MIEDENSSHHGQLYRIAWKFRKSGATGNGPWMHDRDTVEVWVQALSRRFQDVEHWVERHRVEPWLERSAPLPDR